MAVQIKGLRELEQNLKKLNKDINKVAAKAIRKGLNSAAKSIEKTIKPNVPTLKSSTNFRQKGTIKNNVRHKTRVAKDGLSGITAIRVMRTIVIPPLLSLNNLVLWRTLFFTVPFFLKSVLLDRVGTIGLISSFNTCAAAFNAFLIAFGCSVIN